MRLNHQAAPTRQYNQQQAERRTGAHVVVVGFTILLCVCYMVCYICFPISTPLCVHRERETEFVALMNQEVLFLFLA